MNNRRVIRFQKPALAFLLCAMVAAAATHHDVVNVSQTFQTIDNFGASDAWSMQKIGAWPDAQKEKVAELLFSRDKGIGLSCWRFNLGGGVTPEINNPWRTAETFELAEGQYDWSRQSNERWFLAAAKRYGVPQFLAFVNSPPARMTRNHLTFTTKGMGSTNLAPGMEGQYAHYLADILAHFRDNPARKERINFQYVSPVNEPEWEWEKPDQEGNRYANRDIKTVIRALYLALQSRQLTTTIAVLESGSLPHMYQPETRLAKEYGEPYGNYIDEFLGDPEIARMIGNQLSYHAYFSDLPGSSLLRDREKLRTKMNSYPDAKIWESEYCILQGADGKGGSGRDLTMKTALNVARVIHYDLTLVNASAWQWWTAVSPEDFKDGLVYTDYKKPHDAPSVIPSKTLWALGNYSRFVRPGMRRIGLLGDGHSVSGLLGSAYAEVGKDHGAKVVMVYVNLGAADEQVELQWGDGKSKPSSRSIQIKKLTPYITTDHPGDDLKKYPDVKPGQPVVIPANSVVTLVAELKG